MSIRDQIYASSPYLLKLLAVNLYSLKQQRTNYSGAATGHLSFIKAFDDDLEKIRDFQIDQLQSVLKNAVEYVPYYRERRSTYGLVADKPLNFYSLFQQNIPVLEKFTVKEKAESFYSTRLDEGKPISLFTSGTSGSPITILTSKAARQRNYAFWRHLLNSFDVDINDASVTFAGKLIAGRGNRFSIPCYPSRNLFCSSYHIRKENMPAYVEAIAKWQPQYIDAYPSALHQLAQLAVDNGYRFEIKPKVIFTSSETLSENQRELIESVFKANVIDLYGSTEMSIFAAQYEAPNYMAHPLYGYTEVLDEDNNPVQIGEVGEVVTTSFINPYMPLIRYRTGDVVRVSDICEFKGFRLVRFSEIIGRVDDIVVTSKGTRVGRLDPAFKGVDGIRNAQIIQTAVDTLLVKVEPSPGKDIASALEILKTNLKNRTSQDMRIEYDIVDEIPKDHNGKFRSVISRI
jgi:phenylacetate-coenzyme A ligase PaaK-like adenylate-forming protein